MKHVKVYISDEVIEGILVSEDEKHLVVKLESGYNIGISRHNVTKIETLSSISAIAPNVHENATLIPAANSASGKLPKILILHTGGTIASKVDYKTGAVVAKFEPSELIGLFPELAQVAHIESRLFRNMMSDDMRFDHYNMIAKEIKAALENDPSIRGIIITHGTDTLHYTSAALSFIFEHLPVPVVLVGSQRSSDRGSSDSAVNLISAVAFAAQTHLKGVFICMHENMSDDSCAILDGINARKMHSSRRDAFRQINRQPIAHIDFKTRKIEYIAAHPHSALNAHGDLRLHLFNPALKIGFVISHPNMYPEEFSALKDFDGLILEGTGLGHFPISEMDDETKIHHDIRKAISALCKKMPVVMSVQTINGMVNMNVYSPGRELQDIGVIGNHSVLSPETAFIKLAWLLSQKLDVRENFMKDMRGEFLGSDSLEM